jgi:hypothetical protein
MDANLQQKLEIMNSLHEAGHAVMALLVGAYVVEIQIHSANRAGGFGYCKRSPAPDDMSELLITFAGVGAELVHRNDICWSFLFRSSGRGDWKDAASSIERIGGDRRAVIKKAKASVICLLTENWEWVVAVADKLREHRSLTGEDVWDLNPSPLRI